MPGIFWDKVIDFTDELVHCDVPAVKSTSLDDDDDDDDDDEYNDDRK